MIPFSYIKNTWDADALAYFAIVNDLPYQQKFAINKRILAFKANGTWAGSKYGLIFPLTPTIGNFLVDLKNLNTVAKFFTSVEIPSPYVITGTLVGHDGLYFSQSATVPGSSYIRTAFTASGSLTLNDTAIAFITPRDNSTASGFSFGALNSTTQEITFVKKNGSNQCIADMYGTTVGTGRVQQSSANGGKGCYLLNRRTSTNFKLWKNGTAIATSTGGQGTLPNIEMYLNGYNSSGTNTGISNQTISAFWVYGASMTDAQAIQECTDWATFQTDMLRTGTYTKSVIYDGTSETVYWYSKTLRQIQYKLFGTGTSYDYYGIGVSGQNLVNMNTNYATNVAPLYNAGYSKNIIIIDGPTNDISGGASAATTESRWQTYCTNARTTGFKIIAAPVMARGVFSQAQMLIVDAFNTWLAANWATYADAYSGFPAGNNYFLPRSGFANDTDFYNANVALTNNTTYFVADQTHITEFAGSEWGNLHATIIPTV